MCRINTSLLLCGSRLQGQAVIGLTVYGGYRSSMRAGCKAAAVYSIRAAPPPSAPPASPSRMRSSSKISVGADNSNENNVSIFTTSDLEGDTQVPPIYGW